MDRLGALQDARQKVFADAKRALATMQRLALLPCESVQESIDILNRLRQEAYEDVNQIQHEYLIIVAAEWLLSEGIAPTGTVWSWNPRQTGDVTEPDLRGKVENHVILSAEVTTSVRPVGTIDTRMHNTLAKLARMEGSKFYFVRSEEMRKRAATKVEKAGWPIRVVRLRTAEDV